MDEIKLNDKVKQCIRSLALVVSGSVLVDLTFVRHELEHLTDAVGGVLYFVFEPVQPFLSGRVLLLALHPV